MTTRRRSPVGAHVPVGGGLARQGLPYAERVGAEALQVFLGNPRGWKPSDGDPAEDERFVSRTDGTPVFVHAPYLINFGSPTAATVSRSTDTLAHALRRAAAIGAEGVVVHAGSVVVGGDHERGLAQVREHVLPLLDALPDDGPLVLVEPTAGGGQPLAATVDDLGPFFAALDAHPRLGVCLDTCHAFAAGHDLTARHGVRDTLDRLVAAAGRGRLRLVHANDSRDPLGSSRDRHEHIGEGTIGVEPFRELLRHPAVRGVPVVVETPGGPEDQARDVETLKQLRA